MEKTAKQTGIINISRVFQTDYGLIMSEAEDMGVHKTVFLLYSVKKRTENRSVTMFLDIKAA